jgi:hypothetical protein
MPYVRGAGWWVEPAALALLARTTELLGANYSSEPTNTAAQSCIHVEWTFQKSGAEGGRYNLALASIPLHSNEA